MKFLIAKKIAMTRRFRDDGTAVPVTVLQAGPCVVTQVKTLGKDGYAAVQVGFGAKRRLAKPQKQAWSKLGSFAVSHEWRLPEPVGFERGQKIDASAFAPGERLKITGTSKGRGFAGVVKRHHFAGGPASHGHKDNLRMPGSIGATFPQHVLKGTRMAGRMGSQKVSLKNLEVIEVVPEQNILVVKGAVPGPRNGIVFLQTAR